MKKNWTVGLGAGIFLGILLVGGIYGTRMINGQDGTSLVPQFNKGRFDKGKVSYIDKAINTYYIDGAEQQDMIEGIYRGYVYGLEDPYTMYLTADEFNKIQEQSVGNDVGIGLKYAWGLSNQHLIITDVIAQSPAEKAGIKIGDKIVAIDGIKAMGSNETTIYEKLTYSGSDPVTYTLVDNNEENERTVVLKPELVKIDLVESELLENGVGYIAINTLVEGTVEALEKELMALREEGATAFVLDLRDTYGEHLEEVVQLCDLFLEEQEVFQVIKGEDESTVYKTKAGCYKEPVAIITNYYTQGAIEAFVATMQENRRATIVGEKTNGNGTVQEKVALEDGSGLVITTGHIMLMNGQKISGEGIEPDQVARTSTESKLKLITTGRLDKKEDDVLQKAIESLQ